MFQDVNNPTMNELVQWFQVRFTDLANEMKESNHAAFSDTPNPYHLEGSVWTHTMMVCLQANNEDADKINLITALLHDVGKPLSRDILPYDKEKPLYAVSSEVTNKRKNKKNNPKRYSDEMIDAMTDEEVISRAMKYTDIGNISSAGEARNYLKQLEKKVKVHFRGHEGISVHKAVKPLKNLIEYGVINTEEMQEILIMISLHGTLFNNISPDGKELNPQRVKEIWRGYPSLFKKFTAQVRYDSTGRFFDDRDERKNFALLLGRELYGETFCSELTESQSESNYPNNTKKITLLVGVPNTGKSTWLKNNKPDNAVIISRDDTLMEYAKETGIICEGKIETYSQVWRFLSENNLQEEVDSVLMLKFNKAVKEGKDIIIDMTNTSKKSRRKWLSRVTKNYKKEAVVFIASYEDILERNKKREKEEGKFIPEAVITNMMKNFIVPMRDEVDFVQWQFS